VSLVLFVQAAFLYFSPRPANTLFIAPHQLFRLGFGATERISLVFSDESTIAASGLDEPRFEALLKFLLRTHAECDSFFVFWLLTGIQ
jgi:hypothetical protein